MTHDYDYTEHVFFLVRYQFVPRKAVDEMLYTRSDVTSTAFYPRFRERKVSSDDPAADSLCFFCHL